MQPIWIPDEQTIAHSNIRATLDRQSLADYDQLYQWSIAAPDVFWGDVVEMLGIRFHQAPERTLDTDQSATSFCWFPGARLNIAESCFQAELDKPAIVHGGPAGDLHTMSYGEVWQLAGRVADGLRQIGLHPGDAAAIFLPMTARSVAIYLGTILAGCVVVSIADSFAKDELRSRLRIGDTKAIFVEASAVRDGKRLALYDRVAARKSAADMLPAPWCSRTWRVRFRRPRSARPWLFLMNKANRPRRGKFFSSRPYLGFRTDSSTAITIRFITTERRLALTAKSCAGTEIN